MIEKISNPKKLTLEKLKISKLSNLDKILGGSEGGASGECGTTGSDTVTQRQDQIFNLGN